MAVPSTLLERRPDIAAQERTIAAANAADRSCARSLLSHSHAFRERRFGVLQLSALVQCTQPLLVTRTCLSQTLFDGGARRGQNEQAIAQYDAAVANYRQTVLTSFQAVEDQLSTLRILTQEIGEQQTAINSSQRYLDLALIRFKTGVDSYLNVITAQNSLLNNRESQVSSELRRMSASVQLVMALGGGWDPTSLPSKSALISKGAAPSPIAQPTK